MKVSRVLFIFLLFFITAALPFQNDVCTFAVTSGLSVCFKTLIPSLFPFLFFSTLLCACAGDMISALSAPLLCPLFGITPEACRVVVLGTLGGFPSGSYLAAELYREGKISRAEAERLPMFCNNAGPMFVLSAVGVHVFSSLRLGLLLYLVHLSASFLLAFLTRPQHAASFRTRMKNTVSGTSLPLFSLFSQSLQKSLRSMAVICGNFLIFRVLTFLFSPLMKPGLPASLLKGSLEMTGGLLSLPDTGDALVVAAAILGFNGLCVHMQGASSLTASGLSPLPCLFGKGFTALFSASLMTVLLLFISPPRFSVSKTPLLLLAAMLALGIVICRLVLWRHSGMKKRTNFIKSVR